MRILFIHTRYKYRGGEDVVVEKEVALLKHSGCTVEILNFYNDKYTLLKFLLAPFNLFSFFQVSKAIRGFKPDIVHLHNWSFAASPSVIWAVKKYHIPLFHTLHNYRIICPSATLSYAQQIYLDSINCVFPWKSIINGVYRNSRFATLWMVLCSRFNYFIGTWNQIDYFIALTKNSKDIFLRSYLKINSSRIYTKPNFTELPSGQISIVRRSDHFLYIGRLSEEKGVLTLLSAFETCKYKIKLIGNGPLKPLVESYAKRNKNITLLGYKDKNEIEKELIECSALIFPSICIETFGMSIVEAFSTGTPVIATNIGSAIDLVQDEINGLHFSAADAGDLISKLDKWTNYNIHQRRIFYSNALATYNKNYTPAKNQQSLLTIYQLQVVV